MVEGVNTHCEARDGDVEVDADEEPDQHAAANDGDSEGERSNENGPSGVVRLEALPLFELMDASAERGQGEDLE
jgi:hypothetical protein